MTGMAEHAWSLADGMSSDMPCFRCVHCGVKITVLRPDGNRRPSDGELRGRLLPERCGVRTVGEVMTA